MRTMFRQVTNSLIIIVFFFTVTYQPVLAAGGSTGYEAPPSTMGYDPNNPNLTDEERRMMSNYEHTEYHNRAKAEACEGKEDLCEGKAKADVWGMDEGMVQAISKAYSTVVGMAGGGLEMKEGEDSQDYCAYIAMATEILAQFQQTSHQENIASLPTNSDSAQKDSLLKAARSHEARASVAEMQAVGWGATAACYVVYISTNMSGMAMTFGNWAQIILKLGSSIVFLLWAIDQMNQHKQYAKELRAIASKLPGKGACDPIEERICYCAQPETMNDVKYCLPQFAGRTVATGNTITACLDKKMKADPQCRCARTDSCFDAQFMSMVPTSLGFTRTGDTFGPISKLSRGQLSGTASTNSSLRGFAKNLKRRLSDLAGKMNIPDTGLNKEQTSDAKGLTEMGIPVSLSKHMAKAKMPKGASKFARRMKNSRKRSRGKRRKRSAKSKVLRFGSANAFKNKKKSKRGAPKFGKLKKGKKKKSGNVLKFSERAQKSAGITKNKSHNIFKIISHRYRMTGWNRLDFGNK